MCGIAGKIRYDRKNIVADELHQMSRALSHRGPDGSGIFIHENLGFAHRRLAVIDLSEKGQQPMESSCGRYIIIWNGECYNYLELKKELQSLGKEFHSQTDTEVVLEGLAHWGMDFIHKVNGMFAFALYDKVKRTSYLVRDRLGIKPLYYFEGRDEIIFASEIKAILSQLPDVNCNFESLSSYLNLRYVPGEKTLFKGIKKIPAGHFAEISRSPRFRLQSYWSLNQEDQFAEKGASFEETQEQFYDLFKDAVNLRLRSDVEVGALLSGGVDSSAIVGMIRHLGLDTRAYTMDLNAGLSEVSQAKNWAESLSIPHTTISFSPDDYDELKKTIWHLEEPLGDSIIFPTYKLSQEVSKRHKVILSGEGADEVLGGYAHQWVLPRLVKIKKMLPRSMQRLSAHMVGVIPLKVLENFNPYPAKFGSLLTKKLQKVLLAENPTNEFLSLISLFDNNDLLQLGYESVNDRLGDPFDVFWKNKKKEESYFSYLLKQDLKFWCADYTLLRMDKLNMASGLEVRVPFLDHRLVEFCLKYNSSPAFKKKQKALLRESMKSKGILSPDISNREKHPFFLPIERQKKSIWMNYARDILTEAHYLENLGFNKKRVKKFVTQGDTWDSVKSKQIVSLLNLELWAQIYL